MLSLSQTILFYKRLDIQRAICESADGREVAVKYGDNGFGKRPDVIKFPSEVLELALKGATSFHVSEERWNNPLQLATNMTEKDKIELRIGWDLVIDIDCHEIEYSKHAAKLIIDFLYSQGINSISCKFSGNKGFHIAVPFESFPNSIHGIEASKLFPEAPRKIAAYIKFKINDQLGKEIFAMENGDIETISKKTGLELKDIIKYYKRDYETDKLTEYKFLDDTSTSAIDREKSKNEFDKLLFMGQLIEALDASKIADIDTLLISSRHLYRMPYSFNEKSGLISIPIDPNEVLSFSKDMAIPENVIVKDSFKFLDNSRVIQNEASDLIIKAYDFVSEEITSAIDKDDLADKFESDKKEFSAPELAIDREYFPPCMLNALKGMNDGRKRALFAMVNFLICSGWDKDATEKLLKEWNENNAKVTEPLRETILVSQIRYSYSKKEQILPQNCMKYYQDLAICSPDNLCRKIKNPVQYALKKSRFAQFSKEEDAKEDAKQKARAEKIAKETAKADKIKTKLEAKEQNPVEIKQKVEVSDNNNEDSQFK